MSCQICPGRPTKRCSRRAALDGSVDPGVVHAPLAPERRRFETGITAVHDLAKTVSWIRQELDVMFTEPRVIPITG